VSPSPPSILVVDDDPIVRKLIAAVLKDEGYTVRTVKDDFAALRSIEDAEPDCIVLDLMMPGLDGHDVLSLLRARAHKAQVPVVMLSALTDEENIWRAWRNGVDYYLSKPFPPADLVHFLRYLFAEPDHMALSPA
jgi:DNA-binding response OmpR family regulator